MEPIAAEVQPATTEEVSEIGMLIERVVKLMEMTTARRENPNPNAMHAISTILEAEELRYMEETDDSKISGKTTINGRLLGLHILENKEFLGLITSTFLMGSRYSVSVQAATIRLLFCCSQTWTYPLVFEDAVLEKIRSWVINDITWSSIDDCDWKHENGTWKTSEFEMLRTYSTGCLAVCLDLGGRLMDGMLTSELPAKLMQYLCLCVLGETNTSQKDSKPCDNEFSFDETEEDCSYRRRVGHVLLRSAGKYISNEGVSRNDEALTYSCSSSGSGPTENVMDSTVISNQDLTRNFDATNDKSRSDFDDFLLERDNDDNCFQECIFGSVDITDLVKKAVRAAETEARAANVHALALRAAGDAAAEVVKTAALDEYRKTKDEEATLIAASRAAFTVEDAANVVALSRRSSTHVDDISGSSKLTEPETNDDIGEFCIPDSDLQAMLMEKFCIQCLACLGEYTAVIGPVLHEKGVYVSLALLHRSSKVKEASNTLHLLRDILKLICALAANKKFAELFVEHGGMLRLLSVPRSAQTFFGLSSCLFKIGSNRGVMERVCALPPNVIHQIVELALQLLECPWDQARINAALFFSAAFSFSAIVYAFDELEGLEKMLNHLHDVAFMKFGFLPGPLGNPVSVPNLKLLNSSEKQMTLQRCVALQQYFRAHLILLMESICPTKNMSSYTPLDISNATMSSMLRQLQNDLNLGPVLLRVHWPVVDKFISANGLTTMLELCQTHPGEPYLEDMMQYAFGILNIVTLVPKCRNLIVNAFLRNGGFGVAVILEATRDHNFEIAGQALNVLVNLVCPPPSITDKPSAVMKIQQSASTLTGGRSVMYSGNRSAVASNTPCQAKPREWNGESSSANRGTGACCATLTEQLELGYCEARKAVYASDGIRILLNLFRTETFESHIAIHHVNALACQVLLGLARDNKIARILMKLQVEKKLSTLILDSRRRNLGGRQRRWQAEFAQVATELFWVLTNSGHPNTLVPGDYATPFSREHLLLIHQHLQAAGLVESAATVLRECQLTPLPSLGAPPSLQQETFAQESSAMPIHWPSGRDPCGFLLDRPKIYGQQEDSSLRCDSEVSSSMEKNIINSDGAVHVQKRDPLVLPLKRKLKDLKNNESVSGIQGNAPQRFAPEQVSVDSLAIQYLKHKHHQCPAPITTPTPLSLWPVPKRSLEALSNMAARLSSRELKSINEVFRGKYQDRQFVYSKFRLCQTCRDDPGSKLTCISFLGDSCRLAAGDYSGELKVFDRNSNRVLERCKSHQSPLTLLQSHFVGENQLLLSSTSKEVCLWDMSVVSGGPIHTFEDIKNARFSHSGSIFAALGSGPDRKDILLYDVHTCRENLRLVDTISTVAGHLYPHLHFSPSDSMVLWNGILWDRQNARIIHRFNQLTDFEGGGFHPTRNEVILNSEVWDLRKFQLLQSVPSLDRTAITFNTGGDVIYAIMRATFQNYDSWANTRSQWRAKFSVLRTVDAITYSDIATVPVDQAIIDFTTEPTDSFVGLITPDEQDHKCTSVQVYEIGRQKLNGDDSDPDDPPSKAKEYKDDNLESEDDPSGQYSEMFSNLMAESESASERESES